MTEGQRCLYSAIAAVSFVPVCVLVISLSVQTFGATWVALIPIIVIPFYLYYCIWQALR